MCSLRLYVQSKCCLHFATHSFPYQNCSSTQTCTMCICYNRAHSVSLIYFHSKHERNNSVYYSRYVAGTHRIGAERPFALNWKILWHWFLFQLFLVPCCNHGVRYVRKWNYVSAWHVWCVATQHSTHCVA